MYTVTLCEGSISPVYRWGIHMIEKRNEIVEIMKSICESKKFKYV